MIPHRSRKNGTTTGKRTAYSMTNRRKGRNRSASFCRRRMSRDSCTWATHWTAPCRISSSATSVCRATMCSGSPARTMQASPRRSRWRSRLPRKASRSTIWAVKNSWNGYGSGRKNTAIPSAVRSASWAPPATGPGNASPWTPYAPALCRKCSAPSMKRA